MIAFDQNLGIPDRSGQPRRQRLMASEADAIRQFKSDPSDPLLPWLIWEYGLGELLPYLPEPRRAIAEGILWQRLRGTPAALATALSWIGMSASVEQEPPGVHFAEFQLDPGQVLDSDTAIAHLIAIARLSAPARSRSTSSSTAAAAPPTRRSRSPSRTAS